MVGHTSDNRKLFGVETNRGIHVHQRVYQRAIIMTQNSCPLYLIIISPFSSSCLYHQPSSGTFESLISLLFTLYQKLGSCGLPFLALANSSKNRTTFCWSPSVQYPFFRCCLTSSCFNSEFNQMSYIRMPLFLPPYSTSLLHSLPCLYTFVTQKVSFRSSKT